MRYEATDTEDGPAPPAPSRQPNEFYFAAWRRTFDFRGVASRTEFWSFVLINLAVNGVLYAGLFLGQVSDSSVGLALILYWAMLAVPTLSVLTRRSRDATSKGWFAFLALIPIMGPFLALGIALFPARDQQQLDQLGIRYRDVWRKSADYLGDSRRDEYWTFVLINLVVLTCAGIVALVVAVLASDAPRIVAQAIIIPVLSVLFAFFAAVVVASTPLTVRRVRDATGTGWWTLMAIIPYLGAIVVFIMTLIPTRK